MVVFLFFQPTFHKYFLEQAQGPNPNLAHSFSDVIEFSCLGFCFPHLPSHGKGTATQLSRSTGTLRRLPLDVSSPGIRGS